MVQVLHGKFNLEDDLEEYVVFVTVKLCIWLIWVLYFLWMWISISIQAYIDKYYQEITIMPAENAVWYIQASLQRNPI